MTLLLKSKTKATGQVGNVHGNTGPQDYVAMLDFSRGEYFTRVGGVRTDYLVDELIAVARAGAANYQDRDGVWRQSPSNSPRFKYSKFYDSYGLFIGAGIQNYATSGADGTVVTIPAFAISVPILLSWEGTGTATLSHANLTDNGSVNIDFRGRKARRYVRSVAGAISVTLNVVGDVSRVQVHTASGLIFPSERIDYGATIPSDAVTFKTPLLNRIGANGSIFLRTTAPDGVPVGTDFLGAGQMIGLRTGQSDGGIYLGVADGNMTVRPNGPRHVPNGSIYSAGTSYVYNVSGRPSGTVRGLGWTNYGVDVTGMTGGMFIQQAGLASLGAFNAARIGGDAAQPSNAIITHCVIYDRHLSYDEMSVMATMWQN